MYTMTSIHYTPFDGYFNKSFFRLNNVLTESLFIESHKNASEYSTRFIFWRQLNCSHLDLEIVF